MIDAYLQAVKNGASIVLFPAFAVTGKSCGVLFQQPYLLESAEIAAGKIAEAVGDVPAVFGMPKLYRTTLLECAAIARNGRIINFAVNENPDIAGFSGEVPCEENFSSAGCVFDGNLSFSVEFSGNMPVRNDAQLRLFCGAEAEMPGSWRRSQEFYISLSGISKCAVAAAYAGSSESTGDQLYGGALLVISDGRIIASRPSPAKGAGEVFADIDREKIFAAQLKSAIKSSSHVAIDPIPETDDWRYLNNPAHPFLPEDPDELENFCRESFALQTIGLGERFCRCGAEKMVLGISGGLDSTLALVVLAMVCREYDLPMDSIVAVTMPGFGTTGRTKNNALKLAELIGAEIREIPIGKACLQHFEDIGHDPAVTNSVYENSQARERTQILMDIANEVNGIVIGTGDLSEIALGWSTFNGDQMAMYAVNCSIPKTNIAAMLKYAAGVLPGSETILQDVIDTPVSPELLPLDENGEIAQKTETILGAYELHDYYLWQLYHGVSDPEKLLALAKHAFAGQYPDEELLRVRNLFMKRFFTQQFKRTAAPDGIQAGVVSLSARTAWQMPPDISGKLWR
jgi:NAD+ synthase (glutamine-hydrolysing)